MYLFAVRDLASHYQIAWIPVPDLRAETVLPLLEQLFEEHSAPLVLKSDNGSAFIAEQLRGAMRAEEIAQLFSPPRRPSYNGALERSNGVLKTYTHQHAMAEGHPFRWTSDDLQRARELANMISRPWGHRGPTPEEAWQAREPITAEQRAEFKAVLTRHRAQACQDLGLDESEGLLAHTDQARRDRLALRRALEELGYLTMQRVRRAPKKPKRPTREQLTQGAQRFQTKSAKQSTAPRVERHQLEQQSPLVTMPASRVRCSDGQHHHPAPHDDTSAHRGRTITSWTRRFITLLVSLAKTAIFKR